MASRFEAETVVAFLGVAEAGAETTRFLGDGVPGAVTVTRAAGLASFDGSEATACARFCSRSEDLANGSGTDDGDATEVVGGAARRIVVGRAVGAFFLAAIYRSNTII